jgi:cytochrome c biogenesis protein CcmG, thiol:disulfide interchange protein DsbE
MTKTVETPAPGARSKLAYLPAVIFGAVALMFLAALLRPGDPSKLPSMLIGKPAPALTLPPLEGFADNGAAVPGIAAADLAQGKPVIVNFWQSSCAPCVAEHPLLILLAEKTGVPLLGINYKDPPAGARRFLNRYGNPFAAIGTDANGRAAIEWGVYGMPETFIVDGKGRVVYKHIGAITPDIMDTLLVPAIDRAR